MDKKKIGYFRKFVMPMKNGKNLAKAYVKFYDTLDEAKKDKNKRVCTEIYSCEIEK